MSKKLFLFFISYLFAGSIHADSTGIIGAAFLGECKTSSDVGVYMVTPVLGMLINSVMQCKKWCAHQQREFDAAQATNKEEIVGNELLLKSKVKKDEIQKDWELISKLEKYSLKTQSTFFAKQLLKIITDPQAALIDQPFFTTMLLTAIYRFSQIDEKLNLIENSEKREEASKKLQEKKELLFGPDQQKIEHEEARKEYENLPSWVTNPSSEGLTDEVIIGLIQHKLMPQVNKKDKFSSVWERIAAAFAGCLGSQSQKVPYLCLDGVPGVGKTLFAKSLAKALDYHCEVIECGTLASRSDNASVSFKGFERGYSNSSPGEIVKALQKAQGRKGIVIVLDEIDKVSNPDVLLALIDPEQNCRFIDKYLEVPIDLSNVIFISTSNDWDGRIEGRSAALASRLQCVEITSYTVEEKKVFAQKQIQENATYASLKEFGEVETLINELINECDSVEGGVRKVVQLLDAAQSYYQLSKITGQASSKEQIKEKVKATISVSV